MRIQNTIKEKPVHIKNSQIIYAMDIYPVSQNLDAQLNTYYLSTNIALNDNGRPRAISINDLFNQWYSLLRIID